MKRVIIFLIFCICSNTLYATDDYVLNVTKQLDFDNVIKSLENYCEELDVDELSDRIIKRRRT